MCNLFTPGNLRKESEKFAIVPKFFVVDYQDTDTAKIPRWLFFCYVKYVIGNRVTDVLRVKKSHACGSVCVLGGGGGSGGSGGSGGGVRGKRGRIRGF